MKKFLMLVLSAGLIGSAIGPSFAADAEDKSVKARRGYFQAMYHYAGPLFGMMKGKVPYDAKIAKKNAENIKLMTMMDVGSMYPKGTDNGALKGQTRALPSIWAADSKFGERYMDWRKAAVELAAVAGNGKDAMTAKLKAMGATCGGCHKPYRAKDF